MKALLVCAALLGGCVSDALIFACDATHSCGDKGVCIQGGCAFPDTACPNGLRFDSSAGGRGGACASGVIPDMNASIDMAPMPPDFAFLRPDLIGADFAGCVPGCPANSCSTDPCGTPCTCSGGQICNASLTCVACGGASQPCCNSGAPCGGGLLCNGTTCIIPDMGPDMTCVPQSASENCFNGIDDDCDGQIDCADSECTPIAECVQDAPGFALGTNTAVGVGCPPSYTNGAKTINQGLSSPNVCSGCTCTSGLACTSTALTVSAATCPGGTQTNSVPISSSACANGGGAGLNITTGNVHLNAIVPQKSCSPVGTPSPAPISWAQSTQFCSTNRVGAGCAMGSVCVPKLPAGDKHCALVTGSFSCPGNYSMVGTMPWWDTATDNRSCGVTCGCMAPSGGSCGTSVGKAYGNTTCTGTADTLSPAQDNCFLNSPIQGISITLSGTQNPTCLVSNQVSNGPATESGAEAFCCLP